MCPKRTQNASQPEQLHSKGRGTGQMFVCLSIPPALNSHVNREDGAGLYHPPCAGNERKKETLLSLAAQLQR